MPWPKEISFPNKSDYLTIERSEFKLLLADQVRNCDVVQKGVHRYTAGRLLFDDSRPDERDDNTSRRRLGTLSSIMLLPAENSSSFTCEDLPRSDMNEWYRLEVEVDKPGRLQALSCWGLLRGLETLSQLIFNLGPNSYAISPVRILDEPRFAYRGYMLDTARHFISVEKILKLLDAMATNKLNVFHWHLFDDQSAPYESVAFPQLAKRAAFRPNLVYSQSDVHSVISYAAERGIRVIPELDTPGHTYSLRPIANLLTKCYDPTSLKPNGDLGPLNPTKPNTYKVVTRLMDELSAVFPDSFLHAGGDEVDFECWRSNPAIVRWMEKRNMSGQFSDLQNYYMRRVYDILAHNNKTMLVWQEVFDTGAKLPDNAIVQIWKGASDGSGNFSSELKRVVQAGYRAIVSSCWYLNKIDYGQDWVKFYRCEPSFEDMQPMEQKLVLGGEICMWSEFVDDSNVISRSWPRSSAAAERLWSPKATTDTDTFLNRLEQMRCRLTYRGVQAEPVNGPGYC